MTFRSFSNCNNQINSHVVVAMARYAALAELFGTVPCFLDLHETNDHNILLRTFGNLDTLPNPHHNKPLDVTVKNLIKTNLNLENP